MIHRVKDFHNPPAALVDAKWNKVKEDLLLQQDNHVANVKCYRDSTLETLIALYENKCSVCGRGRGYELQVDHYRPRKPRDNKIKAAYNHPGYYWLTYTWSNLIPLCSRCNLHKSNKFPIHAVNRISAPAPIRDDHYSINWLNAQEAPLLINPEIETDPARHFSYKPNGEIVGRTPEGVETIKVYQLNRKDLKRERVELRAGFTNEIIEVMAEFAISGNVDELRGGLNTIFRRLLAGSGSQIDFSLFHVYMFKYFKEFISNKLPNTIRTTIEGYFEDFKRSRGL